MLQIGIIFPLVTKDIEFLRLPNIFVVGKFACFKRYASDFRYTFKL